MVRSCLVRAVWGTFLFSGVFCWLSASQLIRADEPAKSDQAAVEEPKPEEPKPEEPKPDEPKPYDGKPVEFFKAIEDNQIVAILIPRDAKAMVLQIVNKTNQPITIQAPRVFAGVPVLEQVLPRNNNNRNPLGPALNSNKAPQKLAAAFNVKGQNNGQNNNLANGFNGRPNGLMANPLFNIPPEKTLRFSVACVCLEYGKPDPSPHFPYEIRPLETVMDMPQIREAVALLGTGQYTQRVAQIAAWHFSDGMSWEELTDLKKKYLNGAKVPLFTSKEIDQAKQLVATLPSSQPGKADKSATAATK